MKHKVLVICSLLVLSGFIIVAPALADTPTLTVVATITPTALSAGNIDVQQSAQGLSDWSLWFQLVVAAVAGALGGLVYELIALQGNLELPHRFNKEEDDEEAPLDSYAKPVHMIDLGFLARLIIGGLAAVAVNMVLAPETELKWIATAIVAGSAGIAIFRSLQSRLTALLAQQKMAETQLIASKMAAKVDEAEQAFATLKSRMVTASNSPSGTREMVFTAESLVLDLAELDQVEQLLSEAKGISIGIEK